MPARNPGRRSRQETAATPRPPLPERAGGASTARRPARGRVWLRLASAAQTPPARRQRDPRNPPTLPPPPATAPAPRASRRSARLGPPGSGLRPRAPSGVPAVGFVLPRGDDAGPTIGPTLA